MTTTIGEKRAIAKDLENKNLLELFELYLNVDKDMDDAMALDMKVTCKVLKEEILRRMS